MQRPPYQGAMPPPPPPGPGMMSNPSSSGVMRASIVQAGVASPIQMQRAPANFQGQPPPQNATFSTPQRFATFASVRLAGQPGPPQPGTIYRPMTPGTPNPMMQPQPQSQQVQQTQPQQTNVKRPIPMANANPQPSPHPINKIFNGPPNALAPGAPTQALHGSTKKKKKMADKMLPSKIRDFVPESAAYMDLLEFEKKLDYTLMRKRFDIQEALKKPIKQKRTLRLFISNNFTPKRDDTVGDEPSVPSWELRVEGRLLDEKGNPEASNSKNVKRKFSSFFKSLVIELDKDLYGPDNHVVEWHRNPQTAETDGFQVKRPGNKNVTCKIFLVLDHQPMKFKLDPRLARVLGFHSGTRSKIYSGFWEYVKKHQLQDTHEREYFNSDPYLEQIFGVSRMRFSEFPQRVSQFLQPTDPIIVEHLINAESANENNLKTMVISDIEVELDDNIKQHMSTFLQNLSSAPEIAQLDTKIDEIVESVNQLKASREFYLGFSLDPQAFIHKWLASQSRDLKLITGQGVGNPEDERSAEFFYEPWIQEAVPRYFYGKIQQRRIELEKHLGIRN